MSERTDVYVANRHWADICQERERQLAKWGQQDHDAGTWLAILTEEVGEVAKGVLSLPVWMEEPPAADALHDALRAEVVRVAAVAVAWLEAHDRALALGSEEGAA